MTKMNKGITPKEFVQQVFYIQEKVLLDFYPSDDVYKEVLMEANLVIEELQKEEDWTWLRDTVNLGFAAPDGGHHHCGRWFKSQHDVFLEIPDFVYKPSEMFGDCVRLCRWRFKHEMLHDKLPMWVAYQQYWDKVFKENEKIKPDRNQVSFGESIPVSIPTEGFKYGGIFPYSMSDMRYTDLAKLVSPKTWYVDQDGFMYMGDIQEPHTGHLHGEEATPPYLVHMFYPPEGLEPIVPMPPPEPFHGFAPEPHGWLEAHHLCWAWHPWHHHVPHHEYHHCPKILWSTERGDLFDYIEIYENDFIRVPYMSTGAQHRVNVRQNSITLQPSIPDPQLGAIVLGNEITFSRPLTPHEAWRIAVMDVQLRIEKFHVCDETCRSIQEMKSGEKTAPSYPNNPCNLVDIQTHRKMLTELPSPLYVIYKTAAYHAQGSPAAANRIVEIQATAQRLLSGLRQDNAEFTEPDTVDYQPIDYINIV